MGILWKCEEAFNEIRIIHGGFQIYWLLWMNYEMKLIKSEDKGINGREIKMKDCKKE